MNMNVRMLFFALLFSASHTLPMEDAGAETAVGNASMDTQASYGDVNTAITADEPPTLFPQKRLPDVGDTLGALEMGDEVIGDARIQQLRDKCVKLAFQGTDCIKMHTTLCYLALKKLEETKGTECILELERKLGNMYNPVATEGKSRNKKNKERRQLAMQIMLLTMESGYCEEITRLQKKYEAGVERLSETEETVRTQLIEADDLRKQIEAVQKEDEKERLKTLESTASTSGADGKQEPKTDENAAGKVETAESEKKAPKTAAARPSKLKRLLSFGKKYQPIQ